MGVDYSQYIPERRERCKYYALCMAGMALTGWLFFDSFIAAALLALFAFPLEKVWLKSRTAARRKELSAQFKDMLFSLSASFQSGRHMKEALEEAKTNMLEVYPASAPINIELDLMLRRMGAGGESDREVLFDFARRSGSEDARNFADVYYTCLTTGGNLCAVVNRTAEVILEKMTIRREIDALMAQKKYEAKLLTAVPFLILMYLKFSSPAYLEQLYTTAMGLCVMAAALGALAIAFFWSGKIMDIEV
ncbi:MAG: type II secretion system F family protein [Clostridiales bacterium]|nr:type II secretion system F family protein [Clostridiales bacterium]